jgi:hypothetical protein
MPGDNSLTKINLNTIEDLEDKTNYLRLYFMSEPAFRTMIKLLDYQQLFVFINKLVQYPFFVHLFPDDAKISDKEFAKYFLQYSEVLKDRMRDKSPFIQRVSWRLLIVLEEFNQRTLEIVFLRCKSSDFSYGVSDILDFLPILHFFPKLHDIHRYLGYNALTSPLKMMFKLVSDAGDYCIFDADEIVKAHRHDLCVGFYSKASDERDGYVWEFIKSFNPPVFRALYFIFRLYSMAVPNKCDFAAVMGAAVILGIIEPYMIEYIEKYFQLLSDELLNTMDGTKNDIKRSCDIILVTMGYKYQRREMSFPDIKYNLLDDATISTLGLQRLSRHEILEKIRMHYADIKSNVAREFIRLFQGFVNDPRMMEGLDIQKAIHACNASILSAKGLRVQIVPGDGDCFFHSVLAGIDSRMDAKLLREEIAEHIASNPGLYSEFVEGNDVAAHVAGLRNNAWADDTEVMAAMRVLGRPIIVLDSGTTVRNVSHIQQLYGSSDQAGLDFTKPIFVYYNGQNHYNAVYMDPDLVVHAGLDHYLLVDEHMRSIMHGLLPGLDSQQIKTSVPGGAKKPGP